MRCLKAFGERITASDLRRHWTAMMFQKFALLPNRTVLENTCYRPEVQGIAKEKRVSTARHWLERVGLTGFESKYRNQLSGGMQQRVGLPVRWPMTRPFC